MDYYKKVLKDYAVFTGRARRKEYWMFTLFNLIIYIAIMLVVGLVNDTAASVIAGLYGLAVLVPCIAVTIRRLHDTDKSGWWILIGIIPFIGSIVLLVFMVLDSTPGTNQYGPNPKGEVAATVSASVPPVEPPQNPTPTV